MRNKAMKQAIRLRIDRANDKSQGRGMVSRNTVNPNRISPMTPSRGPVKRLPAGLRPTGPKRRPSFGPGSGRTGPGPR